MHVKTLFWLILVVAVIIVVGEASSLSKQAACTPSSARNSSIDDVPAITEALSRCGNGGTIIIPAGETFMIRSPLYFGNCTGCNFQIEGTLKVSDDIQYWENKHAIFMFQDITKATFHSLTGLGVFDGSGQKFWDYFAHNNTFQRPFMLYFGNASDVIFTNLKLRNAPFWFFLVNDSSMNIKFSELNITAFSTSSSLPKNTDGFDTMSCTNVTISNIYVNNGDDCVSFKNGSNYVTVDNITCIGSHGLSVGSLGGERGSYIVTNIYMSNIRMINSIWATRIKFYPGGPDHGTVLVRNVTYKDITVDNCDYAFIVDNCYESTSDTCKQYPSAAKLFDINLINITGKTSNKYDPVVARIDCAPQGTCDLTFKQWNIVAPSGNSTVRCSHYDHPSGITCTPANLN